MARYLFTVPPFSGHINPTLGVGKALLEKGHKVGWISFDPALEKRIPNGGDFLLLEVPMSDDEKEHIEKELAEMAKRSVYGLDSLKFLYDDVLIPMNTKMLAGILNISDSYKPDVIINDHQIFAGAIAAIKLNIPYATSVTAPAAIKEDSVLPNIHKWESDQVINFQKEAGIEGEERLDCSKVLTLVYTTEDFFGENTLSDSYQFIGPIIDRPENKKTDDDNFDIVKEKGDKKNILVSIGTMFDHSQKTKFFDKVVEAFKDEINYNVIVISHPEMFSNTPANFIIREYIPQLKLMPHMDAVVCHAGHNTVCESLYNAKPLVVLPVAYDQSFVASCVTDSGCGIRLNFNRFKATQLQDAVNEVLANDEYLKQATKIKNSFINAGGAAKAALLLEKILSK